MRTSRAIFFSCCLLSFGLIAGCGNDESEGDGSSADAFIADADEICTEAARTSAARTEPSPTTPEQGVDYFTVSVRNAEENLAKLKDLGDPPAEVADAWNLAISGREKRLANTRELLKLSKQGTALTAPAFQELSAEISELDDKENTALAEVGSTACAEVLPPDEEEKVTEFVTFWETQPLDDCTKYTTQEGIELGWGSVAACQRAQENPPPEGFTKKVKVTQIEGVAGVNASVEASLSGGVGDGQKVVYNLVFEDGRYKVDSVAQQAG